MGVVKRVAAIVEGGAACSDLPILYVHDDNATTPDHAKVGEGEASIVVRAERSASSCSPER